MSKYDCGTPQNIINVPIRGNIHVDYDPKTDLTYATDRPKLVYQPRFYQGMASVNSGFRPYHSRTDGYENL